MDPKRKTEIRAAARAATPPPWRTDRSGKTVSGFTCDVVVAAVARGQAVYCTPEGGTFPEADRRFIALAREAVPELLADVDRLEAALARARRAAISAVAMLQEVRSAVPPGRYREFLEAHLPELEGATEPWCVPLDEREVPA